MAFFNKHHYILMFTISSTLFLFASAASDVSIDVADAPSPGSGSDDDKGFLPLARKHVVVHNVVENGEILNIHCKSSEDDLGMIRIPWDHYWGFRFHVNMSKSTVFRCHITWYGGGDHHFNIFEASRDDNPFGQTPVCKECIWEVGRFSYQQPMCRITRDGDDPYCFDWDDNNL